jgi:hypothetical protein
MILQPDAPQMPTADLDILIRDAVTAAQLETGMAAPVVASRAGLGSRGAVILQRTLTAGRRVRPASNRWAPEELAFVRANLGRLPVEEIGAHVGRSPNAIKIVRLRHGWPAPSKMPDECSANAVGRILRKDVKTALVWIRAGILPGRQLPGSRMIMVVRRQVLARWAVNPANWIYFDWRRVTDPHLRRLCALKADRWGDEWLTIGQAARLAGCDAQDLNRWIHAGKIVGARKWGPNWSLLRSMVAGLHIPKGRGSGHALPWSPDADAFMLLAWAVGLPATTIAGMARRSAPCIPSHLANLRRRPALRARLRGHPFLAGVAFRGDACFVDWRFHARRFPRLVLAVDRLRSAGPVGVGWPDYLVLRAVLWRWLSWHASTASRREAIRPFRMARSCLAAGRLQLAAGLALAHSWGLEPFGIP